MLLPFTAGIEVETSLVSAVPNLPEGWEQVVDVSCGSEFRSKIITTFDELVGQTQQTCAAVSAFGAEITPRCGLHAHIGFKHVADLSAKYRLFRFASRYEEHFFELLSPWHERASYCTRISQPLWTPMRNGGGFNGFAKDASGTDRYWWFNGASMHRHGTVEFRLHNGTLDARKIIGWACLLQCIFREVVCHNLRVDWNPAPIIDWHAFLADATGGKVDTLAMNALQFVSETNNSRH